MSPRLQMIDSATLVMEVTLPVYRLHFRREISLPHEAFTACITEIVTNLSGDAVDFQWVQHAAFGEPFFANGEATLFVSGTRGVTWPAGYEGRELLASDVEYQWPYAPSLDGGVGQSFTTICARWDRLRCRTARRLGS